MKKKEEQLVRKVTDMIQKTREGKLHWDIQCQTTEYNDPAISALFVISNITGHRNQHRQRCNNNLIFMHSFFHVYSSCTDILTTTTLCASTGNNDITALEISVTVFAFPPPCATTTTPSIFGICLQIT